MAIVVSLDGWLLMRWLAAGVMAGGQRLVRALCGRFSSFVTVCASHLAVGTVCPSLGTRHCAVVIRHATVDPAVVRAARLS